MDTLHWKGKDYRIGDDPAFVPQPLPDWWPRELPPGWQDAGIPDPAYSRAYVKYHSLYVIVSCAQYGDGKRWVHGSVSRKNREIPSWLAMCEVKDVFFGEERTVLQVMVPRRKWVNIHRGCLHLWHCLDGDIVPDFTAGGDTI